MVSNVQVRIEILSPLGDLMDDLGRPTEHARQVERLRAIYHAAPALYAALAKIEGEGVAWDVVSVSQFINNVQEEG